MSADVLLLRRADPTPPIVHVHPERSEEIRFFGTWHTLTVRIDKPALKNSPGGYSRAAGRSTADVPRAAS